MGERALYVLYYEGGDLLAVNLLLQDGATLLDKFFCMDAERGPAAEPLFPELVHQRPGSALERGLNRYQSGQAGYENKWRLGSRLVRTSNYFRHRNALVNGGLRLVAPLFAARSGPTAGGMTIWSRERQAVAGAAARGRFGRFAGCCPS